MANGAERANMGVFTDAEDSTCAGTFADPAATPPEMVHNDLVKWKELYKQNQQPLQIERMELQHLGASMEGGPSTINSCLQDGAPKHQAAVADGT